MPSCYYFGDPKEGADAVSGRTSHCKFSRKSVIVMISKHVKGRLFPYNHLPVILPFSIAKVAEAVVMNCLYHEFFELHCSTVQNYRSYQG